MYALVKVAGRQFKVEAQQIIRVPFLAGEVGHSIEINEVMAVGEGDEIRLGQPFVAGAKVQAEIIDHGQAPKIWVFKKKRRKKYRRCQGHRQDYTTLKITAIA